MFVLLLIHFHLKDLFCLLRDGTMPVYVSHLW